MATWTYGERFALHLEAALGQGGTVPAIIELADAFERRDPRLRGDLFGRWLTEHRFACGRCGRRFTPERHRTDEGDPVICARCQER